LLSFSKQWTVVEKTKLESRIFDPNDGKDTKQATQVKRDEDPFSIIALIESKDQAALSKVAA
jgi:hypothetical protein